MPKRVLVATTQLILQKKQFTFAGQLPQAATLVSEMEQFQLTVTEAMNDTYEGRSGKHDDLLLAVVLGLYIGSQPTPVRKLRSNYQTSHSWYETRIE